MEHIGLVSVGRKVSKKIKKKFSEMRDATPVRRSYAEFDVAADYWQNSALVPAPQLLTTIRSF